MAAQVGVNFNVSIDPLAIGQAIANAISLNQERGAFTQNVIDTVFYQLNERYNVLTVNMNHHPQTGRLNGVIFHGSVTYGDNTSFGIWAFVDGEFTHDGDGGWNNWAFSGSFNRDGDGGKHVVFGSIFEDSDSRLNEALLTRKWRNENDLAHMSTEDKRNTLIVELAKHTGRSGLQGMHSETLVQLALRYK